VSASSTLRPIHLETLSRELALQRLQLGDHGATRAAPRGPGIQQDDFAAKLPQRERLAIQGRRAERRRPGTGAQWRAILRAGGRPTAIRAEAIAAAVTTVAALRFTSIENPHCSRRAARPPYYGAIPVYWRHLCLAGRPFHGVT